MSKINYMKYKNVRNLHLLNFLCFFVGMSIVCFTTYNYWALFGAFVASLHFQVINKE